MTPAIPSAMPAISQGLSPRGAQRAAFLTFILYSSQPQVILKNGAQDEYTVRACEESSQSGVSHTLGKVCPWVLATTSQRNLVPRDLCSTVFDVQNALSGSRPLRIFDRIYRVDPSRVVSGHSVRSVGWGSPSGRASGSCIRASRTGSVMQEARASSRHFPSVPTPPEHR